MLDGKGKLVPILTLLLLASVTAQAVAREAEGQVAQRIIPCCDPPPPPPPPPPPVDPSIGAPEEFNASLYLNIYPDLMNVYGNNLTAATDHWKNWGLPQEGRRASQIFDPKYYLQHNPDLLQQFGSTGYLAAMQHFMNQGLPNEGRRGSLEFDVKYYLAHNPDLVAAFGSTGYLAAADHYINQGLAQGRAGSADFDVKNYIAAYPDVKAAYGATAYAQASLHWLRRGVNLGRSAPAGSLPPFLPLAECNSNLPQPTGYNRIFINNGPGGPGTPGDTYDGSAVVQNGVTVYQLDNLLRDIAEGRSPKYGPTNLIVCIGPGVFQTEGRYDFVIALPHTRARGFTVGQNWHIHGAGVDSTTLQLASFFLPTVVDIAGQLGCFPNGCETGTIQMTVNGATETVAYNGAGINGAGSLQAIANALANDFNNDPQSVLGAKVTAGGAGDWLLRFVTKGTDLDVNAVVSTSIQPSGTLPATFSLTQQLNVPGDPLAGAENLVIGTNSDNASGIEVSDLTIDDNFSALVPRSPAPLNLDAVQLRSFNGGHYIHRVNVVNAIGLRSEAFPVSIGSVAYNEFNNTHANPNSPPSQDNTIEYVTMSNWGGGGCTAITMVFATGTVRFNVVNGYGIGFGGWEMLPAARPAPQSPQVAFFSDNFAINTDYGVNVDSEYNDSAIFYFNQIIHPRHYGITIGSSNASVSRFSNFTFLYNTIEVNTSSVAGLIFQGNVTHALVGRTDFIADQPAPSGVAGILNTNSNNAGNIYQFNQIFSGFTISVPANLSCVFGNWNEVGTQRSDFPNNVTSPCVSGV
jgi:hypothetical protein